MPFWDVQSTIEDEILLSMLAAQKRLQPNVVPSFSHCSLGKI